MSTRSFAHSLGSVARITMTKGSRTGSKKMSGKYFILNCPSLHPEACLNIEITASYFFILTTIMADSFNKKEREKKRQKKKRDKAYKREQKSGAAKPPEFMYVDEDGNLTTKAPDPIKKRKLNVEDIEISVPKQEKSSESKFTKLGVVNFFNTEKGYGFIVANENGESYFTHADNLIDQIQDGDKVSFEIGKGPKGPIATEVRLAVVE